MVVVLMDAALDHADGYAKYRGKCKPMCEEAIAADPTLRLVRGHYFEPLWGTNEQHWWTVRPDGTIYDPTRLQFPSGGIPELYEEFDGMVECSECGKVKPEAEMTFESRYAFCSYECHGRFIGVY
jgi:hypothetical protein